MSGFWPAQERVATRINPELSQGPETGIAENFEAARKDQVLNNNGSSEYILYGQGYADRIKDIEAKTGKRLENPITSVPLLPGDEIVPGLMQDTRQGAIDEFENEVMRLREKYPDIADRNQMMEAINARSAHTEETASDMYERASTGGVVGSFSGAMVGSLQDPLVGSSLVFGAAKGLSILKTAITEALIAGGTETLVQPNVQSGRIDRGLEGGVGQAATNIGLATGGGLVLGGGAAAIGKYLNGRDAIKIFDEAVPDPTPSQKAARDIYERTLDINEASPLDSKAPESLGEHATRLETAMRALEDGEPIDLPDPVAKVDDAVLKAAEDFNPGLREWMDSPARAEMFQKYEALPAGNEKMAMKEQINRLDENPPTARADNAVIVGGDDLPPTARVIDGYTWKETVPDAEDAAPLGVLYHGSDQNFEIFDTQKIGKNFKDYSIGFHFSDSKAEAKKYGRNIVEASVQVENPIIIKDKSRNASMIMDEEKSNIAREIVNSRKSSKPYDAVVTIGSDGRNVAVFSPDQIKRSGAEGSGDAISDVSLESFSEPNGKGAKDQAKILEADIRAVSGLDEEVRQLNDMKARLASARAGTPDPKFAVDGKDPAVTSGGLERVIKKTEKDIAKKKAQADDAELLEVPIGERVDPETGEIIAETRSIKDILDELEQDDLDLQAITVCGVGS